MAVNLSMYWLSLKNDSFVYYFSVPYHYNFLLCLLSAIGLFYGFSGLRIREGRMADLARKAGALCFGVYLLHEHVDLRYRWYGWIKGVVNPSGKTGLGIFFLELFSCVAILFTTGIFIEYVRTVLFQAVGKLLQNTAVVRFLKGLDREMRADGQKGKGE